MESRGDLATVLPFLPLILRSSSLFWPPRAVEALKALSVGPDISQVDSGEVFFDAILDLRDSVGLACEWLVPKAADGYALFFDELMSRVDSRRWFGEVVPALARLLLRLPSLLEAHYGHADETFGQGKVGLGILGPQEAGIVYLSQELIAALLTCSLFCLFPITNRGASHLPTINFDDLFAGLHPNGILCQEAKIKCLIHYFERICSCLPVGFVSFERKVLPLEHSPQCISYHDDVFWKRSVLHLCSFKVSHSGLIEDQPHEALEVDFANEYLGGGALHRGCVQEEIRFMINPELIAGMLFLPSMKKNEAIEIVGAERFSDYKGYASSFHFVGDYVDKKPVDVMGRRRTRIIAIDALHNPSMRQYRVECLIRETNKAFCGFFDQSKYCCYLKTFQEGAVCKNHRCQNVNGDNEVQNIHPFLDDSCSKPKICASASERRTIEGELIGNYEQCQVSVSSDSEDNVGVATGNWGCGAFGGDPELKSIIQWLAASQVMISLFLGSSLRVKGIKV